MKGFAPVIIIGIIAAIFGVLGTGYIFFVSLKASPEIEAVPQGMRVEEIHPTEKEEDRVILEENKDEDTKPVPDQNSDILSGMFSTVERELLEAKDKGTYLSPDHAKRITDDLNNLETLGYEKSKLVPLRQIVIDLSPHAQDEIKQKQATSAPPQIFQMNCQNDPSPVFSKHITDISKVRYISPPPTMGSGPSLKTHSYIGTEHERVPVYAPVAMTLASGAHYVGGPYTMEFQVSCQVKIRFGHITEPVESIRTLLPGTPAQDSRTQELVPIQFAAGELLGYTTGTDVAGNWDFGVYNSSKNNRYIDDPDWNWSDTHTKAVCPFDYFSNELKSEYVSRFNSAILAGNSPHGESFCK